MLRTQYKGLSSMRYINNNTSSLNLKFPMLKLILQFWYLISPLYQILLYKLPINLRH